MSVNTNVTVPEGCATTGTSSATPTPAATAPSVQRRMRTRPERRALVCRGGQVPAPAKGGEARELEPALPGRIGAARLEQLVAGAAQDVSCDLLECERVFAAHLAAPVAEARRRRLREVLVLRHLRGVADPGVIEHPGLPRQRRVLADTAQLALGLGDEILVAELEVAVTHVLAETPRRQDLRAPPRRELGGGARQRPRLARESLRQLEEGQRGVSAVADQMDPERVGEESLERRQMLHVERRLVAPARLPLVPRVHLEDGGDRLARRHPLPKLRANVVRRDAPLVQLVEAPEVVEEVVEIRSAAVPMGEGRDEERLVRDRDLAAPVEHHAQERRAGAADAEDDHGRGHRRGSLEDELGQRLQRLGLRGAQDECRHGRLAPGLEPLGDPLLRPDQRDGVDELVGHRRDRFPLLAAEVELLDPLGILLPAVAADERVVEVPALRAHAADIERDVRPERVAQRSHVVADEHARRRGDLEAGRSGREARPEGLAEALRRHEDRQPAVGDLGRERDALRPECREVDRDLGAQRAQHQLQRLAEAGRARPVPRDPVVLAVVLDDLARERCADDLDVLARLAERLAPRLAVPALDHLRPGAAEPEQEAAAREEVERRRRHRRVRRRAAGDLQDRGAELDPLGAPREPAEDADRVGAPGLRDPDRVEAEPLRLLHERIQIGGIRAGWRVPEAETELHRADPRGMMTVVSEWEWDPDTYLAEMAAEVPGYEELEEAVVAATA